MPLLKWLPLACALAGAVACRESSAPDASPPASEPPVRAVADQSPRLEDLSQPVAASFRNVRLHITDTVALDIPYLDGALVSRRPGRPPTFDDQSSFTLRIDAAEIAISTGSLTHLLNEHTFAYRSAPLTDLEVSVENGALKQKGKLHKVIVVPFTVVAEPSTLPDGRIRLHPTSVKAAGIPSGGLMKTFGIELGDLVDADGARGLQIVNDDLILDPRRLLPEPRIDGTLRTVRLEGDRIVQRFGTAAPKASPGLSANHMYYRGGSLVFGKLTMRDTDMELIDDDPDDPFDFFPARYIDQLTAGYSKNTTNGGLKVHMPDFGDVRRTRQVRSSK